MVLLTNTCLRIFVVLVLYFVMDSVRSQCCVCLDNQDLGTQEYSFAFPFFSIAVAKFRRFRTLSENLDHTPGLIGPISSLCCFFAISNGTFEWLSKNSFRHSKYSRKRLLFLFFIIFGFTLPLIPSRIVTAQIGVKSGFPNQSEFSHSDAARRITFREGSLLGPYPALRNLESVSVRSRRKHFCRRDSFASP